MQTSFFFFWIIHHTMTICFLSSDYFCDLCVSMINIVHGAENGHTDGNPESWAGQTWLFPVSINAAGPTMYCVHPPLGLDFASVIHCQCSVWRWSLWRQSADLQPQAWEAPSKDFVSPDHVIVILSSSLSFQDSFFFTEKYLTTYDKTIRSPMS